MNQGPLLFLGLLASVVLSWTVMVLTPQFQLGDQGMIRLEDTGKDYPTARAGAAAQGEQVYRANGCQYCHSQFVRGAGSGNDLARGWGSRRTVSRDYLRQSPAMLGTVRYGPDLANIGAREDHTEKLLLKLYDPRAVIPGSPMPRYPYLFEERAVGAGELPSPEALQFPDDYVLPAGVDEVVPTPAAEQLVAYLISLRAEPLFYEVFPPVAPEPAGDTNAPSATVTTNAAPATVATNTIPTAP
jgi:cytochrome c oxidase cbb3-type subunit 2